MIPNDPFETLRMLRTIKQPTMRPLTISICGFLILALSINLVLTNPAWTLIDIVITTIYALMTCWIVERIVLAATRPRESEKIRQNRHRGDRLYIQARCRQLLANAKKYTAYSTDEHLNIVVKPAKAGRGRAFVITVNTSEMIGVDPAVNFENQYRYESYVYHIDPAICAIKHEYTHDIRTRSQKSGLAKDFISRTTERDYLEADDITRIRYGLDSDVMIVDVSKKSTES